MPKKGKHSVGVASQYASALGKNANCQTLVSLTLARDEVPVLPIMPAISRTRGGRKRSLSAISGLMCRHSASSAAVSRTSWPGSRT